MTGPTLRTGYTPSRWGITRGHHISHWLETGRPAVLRRALHIDLGHARLTIPLWKTSR